MRVIRRRLAPAFLFACLVLAVAQPAWAKWYRVETDRFIVYGEGREERVRAYARKLQMFDATLRVFHPSTKDKVPATKLQLYLVSGESDLRRTRPRLPPTVTGYYDANNEGVLAVVNVDAGFQADDILFHEYAHHFMLENFPTAYPAWFVEGFAEYFATTEITPGMIKVGGYNEQRVFSILAYSWLPWDEVLGKATGETRRDRVHVYYGQAWLLTHYMRSDAQRADQLHEAIKAIAAGAQPVKAFYDEMVARRA